MDEVAAEMLGQAEARMQAATAASLLEQSGTQFTKPQASSASTPDGGRSETSSSLATPA